MKADIPLRRYACSAVRSAHAGWRNRGESTIARCAADRMLPSRALRSGDKTLATLGAACIKHQPTTAGFHASAETVRACVFEFSGLKSAFHDKRSKGGKRLRIMRQKSLLCQCRLAWRTLPGKDRLPAPPLS